MDETVKSALVEAVTALARARRPDITVGSKYGGTVFMTDPALPETQGLVGGVFAYKEHVSVEFSNGTTFDDPDGLLEGKGKSRRHVKLHSLNDIDDKQVAVFLDQALR